MSDLRIRAALITAGEDEGEVSAWDRQQLLDAMAHLTLTKLAAAPVAAPVQPSGPPTGLTAEQFSLWLEAEERKLEAEERYRQSVLDREERQLEARMKMEEELLVLKKEQREREMREFALKEDELRLLTRKSKKEEERQDSLIVRTKQYVTVLKDVVGKFPSEAA